MDKDDKRLERLKRIVEALLNETGRTPEEAASARKKAAQLMLDAGVTEADILSGDANLVLEHLEASRRDWLVAKFCMTSVARLSGCKSYFEKVRSAYGTRSDRRRVKFAGYGPDVDNAVWLLDNILREGHKALGLSGLTANRAKEDFLAAFGARLRDRIEDLADAMDTAREERTSYGSTSLVEVKDADIDAFLKLKGVVLANSKGKRRSIGLNAWEKGQSAADKVALGRPVEQGGVLALSSK
jgi:hypothetical protein